MKGKVVQFCLAITALMVCYPVIFLIVGSFMGRGELQRNLAVILDSGKSTFIEWSLLPREATLRFYIEVLLDTPRFFVMFWNSVKIVVGILGGQAFVSIPAAWAFARLKFPFRNTLLTLYIILMLLPFQVLMLSEYLVIDQLKLLDTLGAVILPNIFSTFPVFIMYHFFRSIHEGIIESAKLDGAGRFQIFIRIGLPMGAPGILSAMLLGLLEYWNLIEQPMTFLKDKTLWPLSLHLANISLEQAGAAFVASVITLIPPILAFFAGQDYLELGIAASAIKE